MNCNGIDRIVNPDGNHEAGQELVGKSSDGGDDGGGPGGKHVAAGAEGDHARDRAVDRADEGVFARDRF